MIFRRASARDASAIAEAEKEIFSDPWGEKDILGYITSDTGMCFSALTVGGELIAYVIGRLIAPEGEIYRIAVREKYRRRGIGYRLLDYSVKTSKGKGLETLFLEVRSQNKAAIKLYEAYGFRRSGIRKNYYKNPTDDAILMLRAHSLDLIN